MCYNSFDEQTILLSLFGNRALYLIATSYTYVLVHYNFVTNLAIYSYTIWGYLTQPRLFGVLWVCMTEPSGVPMQ